MNKQIIEEAWNYENKFKFIGLGYNGFVAGAEWALENQWRRLAEVYPNDAGEQVIVAYRSEEGWISYAEAYFINCNWRFYDERTIDEDNLLYWMPIPPLPRIK